MNVKGKIKGICSNTFNMVVEINGDEVYVTPKVLPTKEQEKTILAMDVKDKGCIIEVKYGKLNFVKFI